MSDLTPADGQIGTCPHCGSSLASDANFCPRCGTDLRAEGSESNAEQTSAPNAPVAPLPRDEPTVEKKSAADSAWGLPRPAAQRTDKIVSPHEITLFPPLSGLLDPVGVSSGWGDEILATAERRAAPVADGEELRRVRQRMLQEPTLAALVQPLPPTHGVYRVRWIFGLLALALLIPFFLAADRPTTASQPWSGAAEAYQVVQALPDGANVLLVWAYDPATAGEMDEITYPVLRHLVRRGAHLEVITLLPGGAAMAQRLYNQVVTGDSELSQNQVAQTIDPGNVHFVPGGVTALPLIGSAICDDAGCGNRSLLNFATCDLVNCKFALTVIVAAQAENVQQWLELAQPVNPLPAMQAQAAGVQSSDPLTQSIPIVAVTSAAADLPLRPYWNNRQLAGLVGGFDGAATYLGKEMSLLGDVEWSQQIRTLYGLRWGHLALIVIIFLANLVALGAGNSNNGRGEE